MKNLKEIVQKEIQVLSENKVSRLTDNFLKKMAESTKKVCQYNLDGELIKIFGSAREAARDYNTSESHITQAICNNRKKGQAGFGYIWAYEGEQIRIKKNESIKGRSKPFFVLNMNFEKIYEFDSYFSFFDFLQIERTNSNKSRLCICLRKRKKFEGYWVVYKHEYNDEITFQPVKKNARKIKQFSLEGEFLREFKSLRELEKITGINRKKLSEHLKKDSCIFDGFRFKITNSE
jgi:hypothetical protein